MRPILKQHLIGELLVSRGSKTLANAVAEATGAGELKKLVSDIYTSSVDAEAADVVKRNLYTVLGVLYANAVISHRSALEAGPTKDGHIVLSYKYTKKVKLPGIVVHLVQGAGALEGDMPFADGLFLASPQRAWLDNFRLSRPINGFCKTLRPERLEELLDDFIRQRGEPAFREHMASLHQLAQIQGLQVEAQRFQSVAGALLGTRTELQLKTERGKKRAVGLPFDPERITRFAKLFQALHLGIEQSPRLPLAATIHNSAALATLCFFDAYFSNYIEGTRFEIEEARAIAFDGKIPPNRPDGHDLLGTFRTLLAIANEHQAPWKTAKEMLDELKQQHAAVMQAHPEMSPGKIKEVPNYAGSTAFVDPKLVGGTIAKGFEFLQASAPGFARAALAKFIVAEVHPFMDGNGRVSRIAMNRECYAAGEMPIIIPTVYRLDYLGAIKKLTKTDDPAAYIKMLSRAQSFTASLDYATFETARLGLAKANAFSDEPEDVLRF